ncbi:hypothetical protein EV144_10771 [Flavobacterium sp. 270]|uniref:hypothetical protein n=1 Tax=Flavobacterium sp. 270 TaxID=2512114 RepID=UPI0010663D21|nr:hypothetical protein [Flavobacterium sp. 270]TDW45880.1 hypothetical protein EV144_10771 [Flavobacterium sp. 270]
MIGILFIYWIWKAFSNLAIEYDKNKWTYFLIGLGSYYGATLAAGIIYGFSVVLISGVDGLDDEDYNSTGWNLLFVLLGGLVCYGVYRFLERKLEKERELQRKEGIESIGVTEEN